MILVTAATAPVGRAIVEQLAGAGERVRALTRAPQSADLPTSAELAVGDLSDPASLAAAMAGVRTAFLLAVAPGVAPAFITAASEAGVRRVVFQSSGAVEDGAEQSNSMAAFHADIEAALRVSGLEWTFLRLAVASADALQWAFDVPAQLRAGDVVRGPWADAAGSPIHPADLAAVAVAGLTDDQHAGRVYDLTGPQSLTNEEQIRLVGAARGRTLRYEELDEAAAREAISP
ncbi:MAG: SDR family oxidoreductase, partial [Sciscionella sp.]